jgi:uncharacterized tellurite resistance protein B-like protein
MTTDLKTLVKILVGVAWLDGKIQPEERRYLHQVAKEKGVADDLEIQPLLHELRAVKPEECYKWLRDYLGDRPTSETCQTLIESISALIYSDGTVAIEEAKLLSRLQLIDSTNASEPFYDKTLSIIRKLYQRWLAEFQNPKSFYNPGVSSFLTSGTTSGRSLSSQPPGRLELYQASEPKVTAAINPTT